MKLRLNQHDNAFLEGAFGSGAALAMRVLVRAATAMGASRLIDITSAHVDGCLYNGQAGLDFARKLAEGGATVSVPTTLNVGSLDLLHPELVRAGKKHREEARSLMDAYTALGCQPTWTCAPYQLPVRPGLGDQIAWAESNAVVFANSILGARTERYGDLLDICAGITGRAPAVGLHLDEGRKATMIVSVDGLRAELEDESAFPLLGYVLGRIADSSVAAITGLSHSTTEDHLKALGAAAASSGAVGLFHAVGLTPEAPDLSTVVADGHVPTIEVDVSQIRAAHQHLCTSSGGSLDAVSIGTPHYSTDQMDRLLELLNGRHCSTPLYVSTGRDVLSRWGDDKVRALEGSGVTVVTDTCTYITPILEDGTEVVMTDSAKWAYYAPTNLGVKVVYGSMSACVESAVAGRAVSW